VVNELRVKLLVKLGERKRPKRVRILESAASRAHPLSGAATSPRVGS